jgi:hypothetical protein
MTITVLDPVQEPLAGEVGDPIAPRLATLNGKTLGLWSNEKLNAAKLLELIRAELEPRFSFQVVRGVYNPGALMPADGWGEVERCDAVIMATGDCGACSTSGIANAIELERRGIPAVLVTTTPFQAAIKTSARLAGMSSIPWAVVEHPLGSLGEADLAARARAAAPQVVELLLAAAPASSAA